MPKVFGSWDKDRKGYVVNKRQGVNQTYRKDRLTIPKLSPTLKKLQIETEEGFERI